MSPGDVVLGLLLVTPAGRRGRAARAALRRGGRRRRRQARLRRRLRVLRRRRRGGVRLRRRRQAGPVLRRRSIRPRSSATRARGRRPPLRAPAGPATDLDVGHRGLPARHRWRPLVDLAVLRHGENVLLRGLGDCRFERANEALGFDGGDDWTRLQRDLGGRDDAPDPGLRQLLSPSRTRTGPSTCADSRWSGPTPAARLRRASRPQPGWCALSMLFSDWDRSGRRDLRVSNDRHYYQRWRGAALADRAGEPPRLYTIDDGWARCGSGAWASPART